jgi:hypothetical protein
MDSEKTKVKIDPRMILSMLWTFLVVNYIYCDVFTHTNPEDLKVILNGGSGDIKITHIFLLYFSIVMELPMLMIILSRVLPVIINKWTNIVIAFVMILIQLWSLFGTGTSAAPHYSFFSIIEISCNLLIMVYAWTNLKRAKNS